MAITPGDPNWFRLITPRTPGDFSVITGLDHVVILTGDIKQGAAAYQALLGRAPSWQYSGDGADRVLFTLDNMTVELMAPGGDGEAAEPHPRRAGRTGRGVGEPLLPHR